MGNNFIDKTNINNKFVFTLILGAIIISISIAIIVHRSDTEIKELVETRQQLEQKHSRLEEKARDLEIKKKRLREDPYLIQQLAREKLGLYRDNETRIWIKKPDSISDTFPSRSTDGNSLPLPSP